MGGVMWTGVDAAWLFQVHAEIARSGFLLDNCFLATSIFGIVGHNPEEMKIDITVQTIANAEPAADAPILDDDFEQIAAANRADQAADHAKRIAALATTCDDEIA